MSGAAPHVVVVEDEALVRDLIVFNLRREFEDVSACRTLAEARALMGERPADILLLDVMLPDGDGALYLRELRKEGSQAAIMLLTAVSDAQAKVTGLEGGADDYVTKPFDVPELMARVHALARGVPEDASRSAPHVGVLLTNLGTPASPKIPDVRRYLAEFLSDPRVIDIHPALRFMLLHGIILRTRPAKSAKQYAQVWMEGGSPLLVHSRAQHAALARTLAMPVALGMRYGEPSLAQALEELKAQGVDHVVVVPLYPHEASAATGSTLAHVYALAARDPLPVRISVTPAFHALPEYLDALSQRIRREADDFRPDRILMSYHGLPERQIKALDTSGVCFSSADCCDTLGASNRHCYRAQCFATSRAVALELGAPLTTSFQSRLGRTPWINPFSDVVIDEMAQSGVKRLLVACPSFVADCLETVFEIGKEARARFIAKGGEDLRLVPALNADPRFLGALERLIQGALP